MNSITFHTTDTNTPVLIKECAHGNNICIHGAKTGYVEVPRADLPKLVNAIVGILASPPTFPASRFQMIQKNPATEASEDVIDGATGKVWRSPADGTAAYLVGIASGNEETEEPQ
jgi:hypothetical protein